METPIIISAFLAMYWLVNTAIVVLPRIQMKKVNFKQSRIN